MAIDLKAKLKEAAAHRKDVEKEFAAATRAVTKADKEAQKLHSKLIKAEAAVKALEVRIDLDGYP